ncbi:MAG: class I SAM-dependent methyltransferase [Candidatus Bathyarchaeia archaeon]
MSIQIEILKDYFKKASKEDFEISATLRTFQVQPKLLKELISFLNEKLEGRERMCDLGCGYGFIPFMLGEILGFQETYGVDINKERLEKAEKRLKRILCIDLETSSLPFPENYFDLVTCFGVLEHLRFFDNPIKEAYRILKPKGLFLVSIPNLGDWVNRIRLLLGFQPHSVQVSMFSDIDHIHSCTLSCFKNLLENNGFLSLREFGAKAVYRSNKLLEILDKVFSRKASLSIRFFIVAQKYVPPNQRTW